MSGARTTRRTLGANQVLPHTHHPRDVPGALSPLNISSVLIPFNTMTDTSPGGSTDSALWSGNVPGLGFADIVLPPINNGSGVYRCRMTYRGGHYADVNTVGQLRFYTVPSVGVEASQGPIQSFGSLGGTEGPNILFPVSMETTFYLDPGMYTFDIRWRAVSVPAGGSIHVVADQGYLELTVDIISVP